LTTSISSSTTGAADNRSAPRVPFATYDRFRALDRAPFRPAAFFWALVPPCRERDDLLLDFSVPELLPPRLDAPGELAIFAARDFDMPFFLSASYCLRFSTCPRFGIADLLRRIGMSRVRSSACKPHARIAGQRRAHFPVELSGFSSEVATPP
jgi:hypothetical protein